MKKTILITVILLCVFLCACNVPQNVETNTEIKDETIVTTQDAENSNIEETEGAASEAESKTESETETVTDTETETETETVTEKETEDLENTAYKEIECIDPKTFTQRVFATDGSNIMLNVSVPNDWQITKTKAGQTLIHREDVQIGEVTTSDQESGWTTVDLKQSKIPNASLSVAIEKHGSGDTLEFRYKLTYSLEDGTNLIFKVNYDQISNRTLQKLKKSASVKSGLMTDPQIGALADTNASKSILILGNSFVRSSTVGAILQEMCELNGRDTFVDWVSINNATIATFKNNEEIMNRIETEKFGVVMLCGFYFSNEAYNVDPIKELCQQVGTTLVFFPAHNENEGYLNTGLKRHPDVLCLNWRTHVNGIINEGVDKLDLCMNDGVFHSKPLAGYIGAHMIYRAVFGELPQGRLSQTISQDYVDQMLGDYVTTGITYNVSGISINIIE